MAKRRKRRKSGGQSLDPAPVQAMTLTDPAEIACLAEFRASRERLLQDARDALWLAHQAVQQAGESVAAALKAGLQNELKGSLPNLAPQLPAPVSKPEVATQAATATQATTPMAPSTRRRRKPRSPAIVRDGSGRTHSEFKALVVPVINEVAVASPQFTRLDVMSKLANGSGQQLDGQATKWLSLTISKAPHLKKVGSRKLQDGPPFGVYSLKKGKASAY